VPGFSSPTPSWRTLATMRKRGQRPADGVFVTDHERQRWNLIDSGLFAVPLPKPEEAYLAAGLDVVVIAERSERAIEVAVLLASAGPAFLATYWRGQDREVVLQ